MESPRLARDILAAAVNLLGDCFHLLVQVVEGIMRLSVIDLLADVAELNQPARRDVCISHNSGFADSVWTSAVNSTRC